MHVGIAPGNRRAAKRTAWIAAAAGALVLGLAVLGIALRAFGNSDGPGRQCIAIDRPARIQPDYQGTVVPPNLAPLNFRIEEKGRRYFVRISADGGAPIELSGRRPDARIPESPWHRLLESSRGGTLRFDIYVEQEPEGVSKNRTNSWIRFKTITNTIAQEPIDDFLIYRRIQPAHSTWRQMGIYQRDLRGFAETAVLDNGSFRGGCVNCHAFCNNRTNRMLMGIRSEVYGVSELLVEDGKVSKLGATFGYASWHPSGRIAAFSVNKVRQVFHTATNEVRDVLDLDSLIAYYRADDGVARTAPPLARKDRLETYPAWSPDGRCLYFCSAPITWEDRNSIPKDFEQIRYDLMRISHDIDSDTWGEPETILSAGQTGKSILLPKVSPDGRWLLFTMCDYGCFPVYRADSNLYLLDLKAAQETGRYEYRRLDINSNASESWHSFSSNGRWIAFSSKRDSHLFTRTYLAYLDEQGQVHKPILLPQKDPRHYESCLWTFSLPEFVIEPVRPTKEALARVVRRRKQVPVSMPVTMATPKADAVPAPDEPRQHAHE